MTKNMRRSLSLSLALFALILALALASCSPASSGGNETELPGDNSSSSDSGNSSSDNVSESTGDESDSSSTNKKLNLDDVIDLYSKSSEKRMSAPAYSIQSNLAMSMNMLGITIDIPLQVTEARRGSGNDISYSYLMTYTGAMTEMLGSINSSKIFKDGYLYKASSSALLKQSMSGKDFEASLTSEESIPAFSDKNTLEGFKNITASYDANGNIFIEFSAPTDAFLEILMQSLTATGVPASFSDIALQEMAASATMTPDGTVLNQNFSFTINASAENYGNIAIKLDMESTVSVFAHADDLTADISAPENANEYIDVDDIESYDKLDDAVNSMLTITNGGYSTNLHLKYSETLVDSGENTYNYEYTASNSGSFNFDVEDPYLYDEIKLTENQTGYAEVEYFAYNTYLGGLFEAKDSTGSHSQEIDAETVYYSYIYNYLSFGYVDVSKLTALHTSYDASEKVTTITFELAEDASFNTIYEYAIENNLDLSLIDKEAVNATYTISFNEDLTYFYTEYTIYFSGNYESMCNCNCALSLVCQATDNA